jgi:transposase-like protein
VRDGVKFVNKALLVVVGVKTDVYRESWVQSRRREYELTREGLFSDLKEIGLFMMNLIISDCHTRIQAAAGKMFPSSS